jgi:hypothetical protein
MNIIKNLDTPDEAQEFVENFACSASAEFHSVQVAGTYPGGAFTRTVYFGQVDNVQNNQALHALFEGFNAIYGGKQQ